eukprot:1710200-Rhodomonas_salina.2
MLTGDVGAAGVGGQISVVPVGLNYFAPHKFRSTVSVDFGDPIQVDQALVDMYKHGSRVLVRTLALWSWWPKSGRVAGWSGLRVGRSCLRFALVVVCWCACCVASQREVSSRSRRWLGVIRPGEKRAPADPWSERTLMLLTIALEEGR